MASDGLPAAKAMAQVFQAGTHMGPWRTVGVETFEHQLTANSCQNRTARSKSEYSAAAWFRWARLTRIDVCENLWGVCNSISLWSQLLPAWSSPQCKQSIPHGFWHPFVFQAASDLQVVEMWVESYCTLRSLNRLDFAACAALGEGLRDNHSLYGLHVVGNLFSKTHKQRH